ncbi:MAG: UbiA family prenyltransferase [Hyphomicrobiaceae bacterium]|nr:UbiA family prenyltransferase [Hyphomicrobiaceae bacterium]
MAVARPPLVLDIDGTLIATDLLHECAVTFLRRKPWRIAHLVLAGLRGRAHLKQFLAAETEIDVDGLPLNEGLVAYARAEAEAGREVVIATAADARLAVRLAERLGFVSRVLASDGVTNLKGSAKARRLCEEYPQGFAYAGDSSSDLKVWAEASGVIYAGDHVGLGQRADAFGRTEARFARKPAGLKIWAKALRVHQWAKNALVFVPLILGGKAFDALAWSEAALAFLALGILASATYLINDLADLADDRRHWSKCRRPLAAGTLPIASAALFVPVAIGGAFLIGLSLGPAVAGLLALYAAGTLSYSFGLKRQPILDVVMLAGLFTLRLALGIAAVSVEPSAWLLVFSMFLFLSLSFAKRQVEVSRMVRHNQTKAAGRGYIAADGPMLSALGASSGVAAVFVMVMYIINDAFPAIFYTAPGVLWTFPVILFLWIGRIWLLCQRGELDDDPVAFAIKDRTSLALGGVLGLAFIGANLGGMLLG